MKTALITGSSKGLGRALALEFAKHGYNIILHGRDVKRLEEVRKEIRRKRRKCEFVAGDINSPEIYDRLKEVVRKENVDVFINNAAIYSNTPSHRLPYAAIQRIIDTNLTAQICLTSAVFPQFQRRKGGLIININSIAGKKPGFDEVVYCASKHGLRGYTGSIRPSAAAFGVQLLDVYLGAMKTDMVKDREDFKKFIDPREAAALIYSLTGPYKSLTIREVEIGRRNY